MTKKMVCVAEQRRLQPPQLKVKSRCSGILSPQGSHDELPIQAQGAGHHDGTTQSIDTTKLATIATGDKIFALHSAKFGPGGVD